MNSGLYKIVNKINGKFYIGSSGDIHRRFSRHILDLKKNRHDNQHLQHSWNKYGESNFTFEIYKPCDSSILLIEEQKELDVWVGNKICYNMRKDAKRPTNIGEKRPLWVVKKYADAQKGKPRWTEEQKKQMSIDRKGRKHSLETIKKFKNRPKSCYTGIIKAKQFNEGRIYSKEHCLNISFNRKPKKFNEEELQKIKDGVRKSIEEGRCIKNKVPLSEYETIRSLYLSGMMNKQKL